MTESTTVPADRAAALRLAAYGALGFAVLYLLHRVGQGWGPHDASPATVAAYDRTHRAALLASEVAVVLGLLAFVAVPAGLVPLLWQAGQERLAVTVGVTSTVFVAVGFVESATETALVNAGGEPAAVLALNQLQGRVPVVFAFTALVASVGWTILRAGLVWRWFGVASLVAAVVFLAASVLSLLGPTPEGGSSIYGIALSILWSLLLGAGLWAAARAPERHPPDPSTAR